MANPRIFYPIHAVGIAEDGTEFAIASGNASGNFYGVKGVQSFASNVNFNLEQVFELGQTSVYENIEDIPDVEVTIEKVLDGRTLIQHLASRNATVYDLVGRYDDNKCTVVASYFASNKSNSSGTPLTFVGLSGMYVSALGFNIPVQGNATESVTLVGNNRQWFTSPSGNMFRSETQFNGSDSPLTASGGVQRRENVIMGSGVSSSVWPTEIPSMIIHDGSGYVPLTTAPEAQDIHLQNVTVNVNIGRTELFELGRKGAYFRYGDFPAEVSTTIEMTASEFVDGVDALQDQDNLSDQPIVIRLQDSTVIDLGTSNKLSSIDISDGDAGGGNVTVTYTYTNFNDFTVTHGVDPNQS